jgi:4'-phosphopantetheinyl transferase
VRAEAVDLAGPPGAGGGWPAGPRRPRLQIGAIHVWRADLDRLGEELERLLSAHELGRAERIGAERARLRFARGRGLLRELLGRYLRADPAALELTETADGKPRLAREAGQIAFNLAHSGPVALYAFAATDAVGVDVELDRRERDEVALARRYLGSEQARRLQALDATARRREFLAAWALHEARLKCLGSGLAGDTAAAGRLWAATLELDLPGAGAVAAAREPRALHCFTVG